MNRVQLNFILAPLWLIAALLALDKLAFLGFFCSGVTGFTLSRAIFLSFDGDKK